MTEKKEFPNHEEPSESISPKITASDVEAIADQVLRDLLVDCKTKGEVILAKEVALNRAVIMQIQEAIQVRSENYEKSLEIISVAAQKVDELRATNFLQMKAISARLEKLESR